MMRVIAIALGVAIALAGLFVAASQDWLPLLQPASGPSPAQGTLVEAGDWIRGQSTQPAGQARPALAAEATGEAHWTFVNAVGERYTAASPDEMKRVLPMLLPEAIKPGARLTLLVTEDTVFRYRKLLGELPLAADRHTDLMVLIGRNAYPMLRLGERGMERFYAEFKPGVLIETTNRQAFDEAGWQLTHPLKRGSVRVLALQPGGPAALPPSPRQDAQSQRPLTDDIDPQSLVTALRALSGQTAIVTGRREGEQLVFRPSSGGEQSVPLKPVLAAAEAADVNLVLLQSATPRQPGTRSWLWQRVSVTRLDDALDRDHLADFLGALGTPQSKYLVSVVPSGGGRVELRAVPLRDDSRPRTGIGEALGDLVSDIAGRVVVASVEAQLRPRGRQAELDRRLVPGVPSALQIVYLGLLALGAIGHSVGQRWWARIWPPERGEAYRGVFGYQSARLFRLIVYVALFMPLAAVATAPLAILGLFGGARQPAGT